LAAKSNDRGSSDELQFSFGNWECFTFASREAVRSETLRHSDNFLNCTPLPGRCRATEFLFNKVIRKPKPARFLPTRHGEGRAILNCKHLEIFRFRFQRQLHS